MGKQPGSGSAEGEPFVAITGIADRTRSPGSLSGARFACGDCASPDCRQLSRSFWSHRLSGRGCALASDAIAIPPKDGCDTTPARRSAIATQSAGRCAQARYGVTFRAEGFSQRRFGVLKTNSPKRSASQLDMELPVIGRVLELDNLPTSLGVVIRPAG